MNGSRFRSRSVLSRFLGLLYVYERDFGENLRFVVVVGATGRTYMIAQYSFVRGA
jgi:hypothetical protein